MCSCAQLIKKEKQILRRCFQMNKLCFKTLQKSQIKTKGYCTVTLIKFSRSFQRKGIIGESVWYSIRNGWKTLEFYMLGATTMISYTRYELLNIRATLSSGCHPDLQGFHSDILRGSTDRSPNKNKRACPWRQLPRSRARGNRAGCRLRLEKKGFRAPLPGLILANVRSLSNKLDELQLRLMTDKGYSHTAAFGFTETWLHSNIPGTAMALPGYQLFRADRDATIRNKGLKT